jgi:hypothetical protein
MIDARVNTGKSYSEDKSMKTSKPISKELQAEVFKLLRDGLPRKLSKSSRATRKGLSGRE